jgi:LmbE family N-acetylglucosaminyl deacetylase
VEQLHLTRRQFLAGTAAGGIAALVGLDQPAGAGAIRSAVHIVAHADDTLLFLNPDQQRDIAAGYLTQVICMTAGESLSTDPAYWQGREAGMMAGVASLAGVADSWTSSTLTVNGIPLLCQQLTALPSVSMVFIRLPDGNVDGSGFPASSHQSLQSLWDGTIATIDAIDGSASYDQATLIATLAALLDAAQPFRIRTQDFVNTFGDGDHSDRYAVGQFVQAAYAPDDPVVPQTIAAADNGPYSKWLGRQYMVGEVLSR